MSKYEPLGQYLSSRHDAEAPMAFADVEGVLGFPLPPYARKSASWWSNNPGTHVGVRAWRDAGWRTSRVDIGRERVVFVRDPAAAANKGPEAGEGAEMLMIPVGTLSLAARKLIEDYAAEAGSRETGVARALHEAALARRGRLVDAAAAMAPRVPSDSVELIRQARDER